MSAKKKRDVVRTICYREERVWDSRDEAVKFFSEGILNSDGSEQQRYLKIVVDLMLGKDVCRDS